MKILFESSMISCQGTSVAVNDYAHFNQEILGNESIILSKSQNYLSRVGNGNFNHDPVALDFFKKKYNVFFYDSWGEAEKIIESVSPDLFYTLKGGGRDEIITQNTKSCVHAVFRGLEPHGNKNAFISEWLSKNFLDGKYPFVPHIVDLPKIDDDLRKELNIPKNAIVFGRHGSKTTFNIPFVFDVINKIVNERNDIYFLFLNTNNSCENFENYQLINHTRIIHLPVTFDNEYKTKFINTCDVMLHARVNGESFGLSIAEFSIRNKPIITWTGLNHNQYFPWGFDFAHIEILGDTAFYFNDYNDLYEILNNFTPDYNRNWDVYSKFYNPNTVMEKFKKVFID